MDKNISEKFQRISDKNMVLLAESDLIELKKARENLTKISFKKDILKGYRKSYKEYLESAQTEKKEIEARIEALQKRLIFLDDEMEKKRLDLLVQEQEYCALVESLT